MSMHTMCIEIGRSMVHEGILWDVSIHSCKIYDYLNNLRC